MMRADLRSQKLQLELGPIVKDPPTHARWLAFFVLFDLATMGEPPVVISLILSVRY